MRRSYVNAFVVCTRDLRLAAMSRLTSTQVIERGDYLDPGFDPSSLTMPHLLSILTLHAVKYPTPYNKSKLVQVFNDEIKPRAGQFKKERLKMENSVASSQGITDGITGQSMTDVGVDEVNEHAPLTHCSSYRMNRRRTNRHRGGIHGGCLGHLDRRLRQQNLSP